MERLIDERISARRDNVISRLAAGPLADGGIEREELVSLAVLLLMAGHDTVARMIRLGVETLLGEPGAWARTASETGFTARAADELVRLYSIAADDAFRAAAADFEVGGVMIRQGDGIAPLIREANRDKAIFADADRFDPERDNRLHLGFGFGPHTRLGRNLARAELAIGYQTLARTFPAMTIVSGAGQAADLLVSW